MGCGCLASVALWAVVLVLLVPETLLGVVVFGLLLAIVRGLHSDWPVWY